MYQPGSFRYAIHVLVLGAALGGEGKHGYPWLHSAKRPCALCGADGYGGQLLCGRGDIYRAVAKYQHAIVTVGLVGNFHDKAAGNGGYALCGLYYLEAGAECVAGCIYSAGNEAVSLVIVNHHSGEKQGVEHGLLRLLKSNALLCAHFSELLAVSGIQLRGSRVDHCNVVHVHVEPGSGSLDILAFADKGNLGDALIGYQPCGLNGTLLTSLGKHYVLYVSFCFCFDGVDDRHYSVSFQKSAL